MIAGAAIGKATRRLWVGLPVAFLSHFVLDFIPHLDSHAMFGIKGGGVTRGEATMAALDALLGIALVLWAVGRQPRWRAMLMAAFLAIVIDFVDNVPPWSQWFRAWPGTSWLSAFHHAHQHNVTPAQWPLGFGTQIAVTAIAMWLVLAWKPPWARKGAGVGALGSEDGASFFSGRGQPRRRP